MQYISSDYELKHAWLHACMCFCRQCRREEAAAAQAGQAGPPGLLTTQQFRHVWRSLGLKISREQAVALFLRHGCDAQGLLPYEVFAAKLQVRSRQGLHTCMPCMKQITAQQQQQQQQQPMADATAVAATAVATAGGDVCTGQAINILVFMDTSFLQLRIAAMTWTHRAQD
jgi:hypothetical protein